MGDGPGWGWLLTALLLLPTQSTIANSSIFSTEDVPIPQPSNHHHQSSNKTYLPVVPTVNTPMPGPSCLTHCGSSNTEYGNKEDHDAGQPLVYHSRH